MCPRGSAANTKLAFGVGTGETLKAVTMERIKWHTTELNTPVAGMKSQTAATTNGPVKWGTTSVGTFVIICDSGAPEGQERTGRDYAVVLHERGGKLRIIAERVSLNAAAEECRAEIKRLRGH
ncbi:hypothetical protein BST16_06785 [Mycobacterium asiaticum DSM 44297]|nr:hypothetical protein BST16_06785 [Mycobacterium asiaticum DSM 44297]